MRQPELLNFGETVYMPAGYQIPSKPFLACAEQHHRQQHLLKTRLLLQRCLEAYAPSRQADREVLSLSFKQGDGVVRLEHEDAPVTVMQELPFTNNKFFLEQLFCDEETILTASANSGAKDSSPCLADMLHRFPISGHECAAGEGKLPAEKEAEGRWPSLPPGKFSSGSGASDSASTELELPLLKSALPRQQEHDGGICKPCRFVFLPHGCQNGATCGYCHLEHQVTAKRARDGKDRRQRLRRTLTRQQDPKSELCEMLTAGAQGLRFEAECLQLAR